MLQLELDHTLWTLKVGFREQSLQALTTHKDGGVEHAHLVHKALPEQGPRTLYSSAGLSEFDLSEAWLKEFE